MNLISEYKTEIEFEKISDLLEEKNKTYDYIKNKDYKTLFQEKFEKAKYKNYRNDIITIGEESEISSTEKDKIQKNLEKFIPWRKGPFSLFGIEIDAEWQSHLKWNRVLPFINLENKRVCDLGCNNGYYMYRMMAQNPSLVLGFDPTIKYKLAFDYLQKFTQENILDFLLFGFDELLYFPKFFDVVFCMGIVYHHKNPIDILLNIFHSLKSKGQIIVETMGIEGEDSIAFFPGKTYAGAKGFWFIPTKNCLINWLKKAGFQNIECHYAEKLDAQEQRQTIWAPRSVSENYQCPVAGDSGFAAKEQSLGDFQSQLRIIVTATK